MFEFSGSNLYPNIILADTTIKSIEVEKNKNIHITFNDDGFFIKKNNQYMRAYNSKIILKACNIDNIIIDYITHKTFLFFDYRLIKEVNFTDFINNINSKKWRCTIINEFYSNTSILMCIYIRDDNKRKYRSFITLEFKEIEYFWDMRNN